MRWGVSCVWYFAYGSNMQTATFQGRRGIEFHRAVPGHVAGWRLVFDKPALIPLGESYANIVPDPGATVTGVLYEINEEELGHIDLTEGVLIGNYERVTVTARTREDSPSSMTAFTLTSDRRDSGLQPSQRYMNLLIEGAIEHGLPTEYVSFLRTVPAQEESPAAAMLRPLIDEALRRLR